ncbi:MAG: hypothetical protein J5832_00145 [Clostridia bacterium]|nr:hypothetical protein [Clostridia bacterium]
MAEGFREWGDYGAEEEWKSRPPIRKIFSFRAFKLVLKIIGIAIIVLVYGILAYRLLTGLGVPDKAKKMLWTPKEVTAYAENGGNLTVYSQEPEAQFGSDGHFSIYLVKYVPETNQLQLTLRYNRSTVADLKSDLTALYEADEDAEALEKALALADEDPFTYILRDDTGKVYTSYYVSSFTSGLYTYVRLAFDGVELFDTETAAARHDHFDPDVKYSDIIYKGINKSIVVSSDISYLYIDFYYSGDVKYDAESWADPLLVYRSGLGLSEYDISKDTPERAQNDNMRYVQANETK